MNVKVNTSTHELKYNSMLQIQTDAIKPLLGSDLRSVQQLLASEKLFYSDITSDLLANFFAYYLPTIGGEQMLAVIGWQVFADCVLLRSLASRSKGLGLGHQLVAFAEQKIRSIPRKEIYLLTNTAEKYFQRLGYQSCARETAPLSIQGSSQFSGLCPTSARLMSKCL